MNFSLLVEESHVHDARQRFPLFYDACLRELPDPGLGIRHALVCDTENTVLAVLEHRFPYRGSPITVVSLVAHSMEGVHRLLYFLRRLLTESQCMDVTGVVGLSCARAKKIIMHRPRFHRQGTRQRP